MPQLVETNVIGVIRVTNAMLPLLRRSPHPRIVNQSSHVGSLALQTSPGVDLAGISGAYAPTKTYLNAVTVQYAKELRDTGILINNACPGYVATDLNGFSGHRPPSRVRRSQSGWRPFRTTARQAGSSTTTGSSPGDLT